MPCEKLLEVNKLSYQKEKCEGKYVRIEDSLHISECRLLSLPFTNSGQSKCQDNTMDTLHELWHHFKHFQKICFDSRCSSEFWWRTVLQVCRNIGKLDIERHNINSLAQRISNQMVLVIFSAVYVYHFFIVVNFTMPFVKKKRKKESTATLLPLFIAPQASPWEFLCSGQDCKWL